METASRSEITFVAGSLPGRATAAAEDPSCSMAAGSADDRPPDRSDAGPAAERLARLVEELDAAFDRGGESRFETPGFAAVAADGSEPDEESRFEATGFAAAHPQDGSPGAPGQAVTAAGAGRRGSPWESEITAVANAHTVLPRARQGPSLSPAVGETLGEYRLLACLGRGLRGAVFLADQPGLAHRPVVLKVTPRDGREHLSLALLRHPHIVPLYCVQDLDDRDLRLLCMPYLGGCQLGQLLAELNGIPSTRRTGRDLLSRLDRADAGVPLSVPGHGPARQFLARASYLQAVCWIGACLADALQFAHQRDLVHLDLKPSNILLAADGTPMLLDFHLAQPPIRPDDSAVRWLGGTPHYLSPEHRTAMLEVREGRPVTVAVDGRSDIYALGLVLYQMLGGAISIGPYPMHPVEFRRPPGVPVGLADILAKCLALDPRDRYPDAARLAEDLRRHLADLPLRGVRNRSLTERFRKWCRRHPHAMVRATGTAAIFTATLVVGWLVADGDARQRLRGAESLLSQGRKQMGRHDYPAAARALDQGMALIDHAWSLSLDPHRSRSDDLRRDLARQLARVRNGQLAGELHELADRLRFLYGTDLAPSEPLRALERRLRATWDARGRILSQLGGALDQADAQRLRTDFLDLGILRADLHVRLASGSRADARRDALRTLDEAERLFGPSSVLARERQSHAEALGLTDLARAAARSGADLAPRTAWEHYALGRSLLASGDLDAAAVEFDRATDLQPQDLWAQFSRGICAYRRRRFETALSAFDVCVALSPSTAECYFNRGRAHSALGHADLARRDQDHALRLAPATAPAALNRDVLHQAISGR